MEALGAWTGGAGSSAGEGRVYPWEPTGRTCSEAKGIEVVVVSTVDPGTGVIAVRRTQMAIFALGSANAGVWLQGQRGVCVRDTPRQLWAAGIALVVLEAQVGAQGQRGR